MVNVQSWIDALDHSAIHDEITVSSSIIWQTRISNLCPKAMAETSSSPDILLTLGIRLNSLTRHMDVLKECLAPISLKAEQDVLIRKTLQKAIGDGVLLQRFHRFRNITPMFDSFVPCPRLIVDAGHNDEKI
jgi:hypothetical protein